MKLLKVKQWLRLKEVAKALTVVLGEKVREADVLQLALQNDLSLSVYLFEPVIARSVVSGEDEHSFELGDEYQEVSGLLTLLFTQSAMNCVRSMYRRRLGAPKLPLSGFEGIFLHDACGRVFQLQELDRTLSDTVRPGAGLNNCGFIQLSLLKSEQAKLDERLEQEMSDVRFSRAPGAIVEFDDGRERPRPEVRREIVCYPAPELPKDSLICVSTNGLSDYMAAVNGKERLTSTDHLGESERTSVLKMILGMAIAKYDYRPGARNSATGGNRGSISADLERMGLRLDAETIRKFIHEAERKFSDVITRPEDQ